MFPLRLQIEVHLARELEPCFFSSSFHKLEALNTWFAFQKEIEFKTNKISSKIRGIEQLGGWGPASNWFSNVKRLRGASSSINFENQLLSYCGNRVKWLGLSPQSITWKAETSNQNVKNLSRAEMVKYNCLRNI